MAHQSPKPILKNKKKAFTRPQQHTKNNNDSFKQAFDEEFLATNPWGQFLLFVEDYYRPFYFRNREQNQTRSSVLRNAINLLNEYHNESWGEILNRVPQEERLDADELYRYISRHKRQTPYEVYQQSVSSINGLINNAEYGFLDTDSRDIGRISQLSDAINYFQGNQSRTYLILAQLPEAVGEDAKPLFAASWKFGEIIAAGAVKKLQDFSMALMRYFKVTRTAIKDEAASNLVLSMGEIERDLKTQISILEQEKLELEYQLEQTRIQARQEAVIEIANLLQNGRQPALDQIQKTISLLEAQVEETGEAELSSEQGLSIFIILRSLMEILNELGIEAYPKSMKKSFEISQLNLGKYSYIEGTSFNSDSDIKTVECTHQGWLVGDTVITPAKVKELSTDS